MSHGFREREPDQWLPAVWIFKRNHHSIAARSDAGPHGIIAENDRHR
jgi:hypothetical protein